MLKPAQSVHMSASLIKIAYDSRIGERLPDSSIVASLLVVVMLFGIVVLCSGSLEHKLPRRRRNWCETSCRLIY